MVRKIIVKKIDNAINKGATQMAFKNWSNYDYFAKEMKSKGYKVVYVRSSGPTIEGENKKNAIYAIATKKPKRKRVVKVKKINRNLSPMGNIPNFRNPFA